jgi:ATP-dependent Lon protease
MENLGYGKGDITLPESVVTTIIHRYTREAGVRRMKQMLTELADEINLRRMIGLHDSDEWPVQITDALAHNILGQRHLEVPKPRIAERPMPGMIHGMYATMSGIGGVLMIEVYPIDGDKDRVTGSLGDVMKESVQCASSVARSLLDAPTKQSVHIHIPEAATPKDGPSAGIALALALWSCWTGRPLNHRISVTGEVDLSGQVRSIGGLEQKICGALRAGMERVAVPLSNKPRLEQLFSRKRFSSVVRRNQVCFVDTIQEAMDLFTTIPSVRGTA